ncbi:MULTISPECIES: Hint domain-containing protein [Halocynthiibacter]|uniref:Hint domain-containing protein n=1 Tax=Halocynthiibacter halioticoli TaxID=2986804 RepID=A0AAE3IX53_9RHOB|nr:MULTISPECIES: Hint domain-containing protein [Halocynthiibacter]MCV6823713.1 Hint domain-containing protein [Halocynthiibacter halioticoli]MCW4056714.1 Hint domain-containing protein [Halocynthiibacter sp. SDUM655004]
MRPHHAASASAARLRTPTQSALRPRPDRLDPRSSAPMRRFEIACLDPNGLIDNFTKVAPSLPLFEEAFSAVAHGGILHTDVGPTSVEDLLPGCKVQTVDDGFQEVLWIGSTMIVPQRLVMSGNQAEEMGKLTRIAPDSFGLGRPMPDLMVGPAARMPMHNRAKGKVLAPIRAMENSETVIGITPVSPVKTYHIGFAEHHIIRINGLELESYHPGDDAAMSLTHEMEELFLEMFPHVEKMSDFGPQCLPRLSFEEMQAGVSAYSAA